MGVARRCWTGKSLRYAIKARYYKLFWKPMGRDLLQKWEIRDPMDGRSWPTARLRLLFIDLLPDHLHDILDVRSLRGLVRFAFIGAFLVT